MSLPGSRTLKSCLFHVSSSTVGSSTLNETFLDSTFPIGGCFAPVRRCFAVNQYSRLSTSIENIVPVSELVLTIKTLKSMLLVGCADWAAVEIGATTTMRRVCAIQFGKDSIGFHLVGTVSLNKILGNYISG